MEQAGAGTAEQAQRGQGRRRYLTVRQAAEILQVSRRTICRAIRAGQLTGITAGHGYRILDEDFDAWVAQRSA